MDDELKKKIDGATDKVKEIPLSQATPLKAKLLEKGKGGKPVPTVFGHITKIEWMREFPTWRERILILFGCNLVVQIGIACQHNPGVFQPLILGKITKEKSPDEFMRHIISTMLDEKSPPSAIQHEKEPCQS